MRPNSPDVFVGVASIPARSSTLQTVVERLLPQAARMGVYLNGYTEVPDFLRHRRIVVARSQDHGDLRDNGKFYFLDQCRERYYATADDDILYPKDYLDTLVRQLTDAGQRAAVGVHGVWYPHPVLDLFNARTLVHFATSLPHVMPVHLLGTGTTLIDQADWQLQLREFGTPGMADVWLTVAARRRGASLFAVPRNLNWLEPLEPEGSSDAGALFHEGLMDSSEQLTQLREAAVSEGGLMGLVAPLVASDRFADQFSIDQALRLDTLRTQLGFKGLTHDEAMQVHEALDGHRSDWPNRCDMTRGETETVTRLLVDVLAARVSARSLLPALDTLARLQTLAKRSPSRWKALPHALRFDTRHDRMARLRTALLDRGMHGDPDGTRDLWAAIKNQGEISLEQALAAEQVSVRTQFERLPAFEDLARQSPDAAIRKLHDYLQVIDWTRGIDMTAVRLALGPAFETLEAQLLVAMGAIRVGDLGLAARTVRSLRQRWPWDVDVHLMAACLAGTDGDTPADRLRPALQVLDQALIQEGLTPYSQLRTDCDRNQAWIHCLGGQAEPISAADQPLVSVLMTTHNDADTITAAMNSVLQSSGVRIELIVVDDASTDRTGEIIRGIEDPRVTVIANTTNVGPYLSRNRALAHASGKYVAIADADDWSHPQRLAYQSAVLDGAPELLACKVAHVRIRQNGDLDLENHTRFMGDGPVSLLYHRWVTDHIGGFDHVRTRGDIEFLRRLTARFGSGALTSLGAPLILAMSNPRSNSKLFGESSLGLYRKAFGRWHGRHAGTDALYVPLAGARAPFMAPHDLLVHDPGVEEPVASQ